MTALLSAYVSAIYGGSYPTILLNTPGTAASAATAMDGYPLAKAGRGGGGIGPDHHSQFHRHVCLAAFRLGAVACVEKDCEPRKGAVWHFFVRHIDVRISCGEGLGCRAYWLGYGNGWA
jgi:hypothetical protein